MYQNLNKEIIKKISKSKREPSWMLDLRLLAFEYFLEKKYPSFGPNLKELEYKLNNINFYIENKNKKIKNIQNENIFSGIKTQYDSQTIYHKIKEKWLSLGIIFLDLETALKKHEDLVYNYFSKCVSISDHKFISLHYAVWSGGSFLYIPKNISVFEPFHSYFSIQSKNMGQFEHTLIIVEENSYGHYIEGCGSPNTIDISLHSGCVEIFVKKNAKFNYSSIENWSKKTYNLNTKRAILDENAHIDWISSNTGSKVTMLYPMTVLKGQNSSTTYTNITIASKNQYQDTGVKVFHIGQNTTSNIISKSISKNGGYTNFRSLIKTTNSADNSNIFIKCDNLLLDDKSQSDNQPTFDIQNNQTYLNHEAKTGRLNEDILFYLQTKGLSIKQATNMILSSFISPFIQKLPLEYAIEINRMIEEELYN